MCIRDRYYGETPEQRAYLSGFALGSYHQGRAEQPRSDEQVRLIQRMYSGEQPTEIERVYLSAYRDAWAGENARHSRILAEVHR